MTQKDIDEIVRTQWNFLNSQYEMADSEINDPSYLQRQWSGIRLASSNYITHWDTGVTYDLLQYIGVTSVSYLDEFVNITILMVYL